LGVVEVLERNSSKVGINGEESKKGGQTVRLEMFRLRQGPGAGVKPAKPLAPAHSIGASHQMGLM